MQHHIHCQDDKFKLKFNRKSSFPYFECSTMLKQRKSQNVLSTKTPIQPKETKTKEHIDG